MKCKLCGGTGNIFRQYGPDDYGEEPCDCRCIYCGAVLQPSCFGGYQPCSCEDSFAQKVQTDAF